MKKIIIATGALFLVTILYTSCKSHQTCPAYGSVSVEQTNQIPS